MQHSDAATRRALLRSGDIDGLLALSRATWGDATMTQPTEAPAVVLPPAPPAPPVAPVQIDLQNPAIQAAIQAARDAGAEEARRAAQEALTQRDQQLVALQTQFGAFQTDLDERRKAAEEAEAARKAAEEQARVAELSFEERQREWQEQQGSRIAQLESDLATRDALIEKERQYSELMQYRGRAIASETGQSILPELRELVTGNTVEQIDASISALAERSAAILENVAQATQAQRQQARGVGVTAPPVGPLDTNSGYETMSQQELADLDMSQYAQLRGRLLGAASQSQQGRGMFG